METERDYRTNMLNRWVPSIVVLIFIFAWIWMWHSRDVVAEQLERTQSALEECESNYEWDDPELERLWDSL